ncbi:Fungal Zn(2)-Cys(6) binuclear cluster domain [Rhizoctonia solani]|uniref:Fungal Zn(2)-Cys(6) binuclear cluster domain n=1 Tax=Rhizoctonia solani TaxID=456999 RepID=A0A8H8SWA4_9AGAM|nr:Fungal Zn(2)-Cys(6) binuclear cluster domain [Rhizoctonia solani]QRW20129.1 Fungal Zn(2)-Cys(6) binuclear cluster domain [Rhizoctonia solani]
MQQPSSAPAPASSSSGPLRRNQACHQCRARKLKCDAGRPCSTCKRSHAKVVAALTSSARPCSRIPVVLTTMRLGKIHGLLQSETVSVYLPNIAQ